MLRTSSFFGPLNSGFVPFSPAAPVDAIADSDIAPGESATSQAEAAAPVARAAAVPAGDAIVHAHAAVTPWAPATSAHIRLVEGAVLAAVCAYFAYGLLRMLGLF